MRTWPLLAYAGLYGLALGGLVLFEDVEPTEPLSVLAVFGIAFSGLAWWTTRGLTPRAAPVRFPRREGMAVLGYLAVLVAFITWGLPAVRALVQPGWPAELLVLASKIAAFVAVPILLWHGRFQYPLGVLFETRAGLGAGHWRPTVALAMAVIAFQAFLGRAGTEVMSSNLSAPALALALLAGFVWLVADVGIVEEVCFRGFLQTRLAAWADSQLAGLVAMALLFGLAHAPGFYLRPALSGEHLGAHPSLLLAVGYSVVYTSVAGLFYGVLWLRTRNLWVVALVHAAQDLLPTVAASLRHGFPGA